MESIKKDILCCFFFRPALVVCKTVCFHLPVASVSCLFYFSIWFLLLLFLLLLPAATLLSLLWPLLLCFGFFLLYFYVRSLFFCSLARFYLFIFGVFFFLRYASEGRNKDNRKTNDVSIFTKALCIRMTDNKKLKNFSFSLCSF